MKAFWDSLSGTAKQGMLVGLVCILAFTAALGWWIWRSDFQILFADLKPQDALTMTAELEKLKVPYRYDEESGTILVDKPQVHATRIKLMGKDIPLHGAVGFELFSNTDFGMTEFAQKINYQRALQGELTRTILSLSEIRDVRVHLALPEQGLFKQANVRPKAAVSLTLREGKVLGPAQINGIQRLVAAATPGMTPQDVTVVDKQGVALSRTSEEGFDSVLASGGSGGSARLELKKETETHLVQKANAVLEKTFGVGEALASVDVTLNMDQTRTTTEDVIPAPGRGAESRGVIVRERDAVREGAPGPLDAARVGSSTSAHGANSHREVDYQVGRRVEQVVGQAGAVRKIQVVAVVRQSLDGRQEEKVRALLAASVGANLERGDTVIVQSLAAMGPLAAEVSSPSMSGGADRSSFDEAPAASLEQADASRLKHFPFAYDKTIGMLLAMAVFGGIIYGAYRFLRGNPGVPASMTAVTPAPAPLSVAEREAALRKMRLWMQSGNDATLPN